MLYVICCSLIHVLAGRVLAPNCSNLEILIHGAFLISILELGILFTVFVDYIHEGWPQCTI